MTGILEISQTISPYEELLSFEYLNAQKGMSLKRLSEETVLSGRLSSEVRNQLEGLIPNESLIEEIENMVNEKVGNFSVVVNGTPNWPKKISDSQRPTPILYYRGDLSLIERKSVAVVGARKATQDGLKRASRIARELTKHGYSVVTGLAKGIDTAASSTALESGGVAIGVIGTPIDEVYPKENEALQNRIAENYLLISQVPFYRYAHEPFRSHRVRFPERNELMASITDATVIVEASDTSGTLTQARACLHQKRPLFLMNSLLENKDISWTSSFIGKDDVYVLEDVSQIIDVIGEPAVVEVGSL